MSMETEKQKLQKVIAELNGCVEILGDLTRTDIELFTKIGRVSGKTQIALIELQSVLRGFDDVEL